MIVYEVWVEFDSNDTFVEDDCIGIFLWKEHEDVRGDDMIEVGYAEQFLQDLLCEFGCWDEPEDNKEQ